MKSYPSNPIKFLWLYVWRNKKLFCLIILTSMGAVATSKLTPYYFSKLVGLFNSSVGFSDIKHSFFIFLCLMVMCSILSNLLDKIQMFITDVIFRPLVFKQMCSDLFLYLSRHSFQFFADNMAGALANKSNTLAEPASGFYIDLLYYLSRGGVLLFTFFLFCTANIGFALSFLILISLSILFLFHIGKKSVAYRADMAEAKNELAGNLIDALQNSFFVRLFNGYRYEEQRASLFFEKERSVTNKSVLMELCLSSGQKFYFDILYLLFLLYGFYLWRDEAIDGAQLVLILLLLKDVAANADFLLHRGIIYSGVLSELRENLIPFATPHDITDRPNAPDIKVTQGLVEFRNVTFGYKNMPPIFKNFSLEIKPKQKVGIVGLSGSGKSSLINILQRFYNIQNGTILIDGQNIARVTQQSLHEAISYVPQTTTLLERSIAENIAYGKPNASQRLITQAAKAAFAHDFISLLPQKYKTILKGDIKLSGGERQRLSIARALLKNAPVLLLDEATAALDSLSETYIQQALNKLIQNKTVIAVAHRLATLKNMDRIIVLDKGRIVEDGTPAELLAQKGKFYELWTLQQLEEPKNG